MASWPKISTILSWIFYLVPLYIFVGAPLVRQLFPGSPSTALQDEEISGANLHLSDDNFISREDGVPLNCRGGDDYRVYILSREPLVVYIEGFLKDWEADHLVEMRFSSQFFFTLPTFPTESFPVLWVC